MSKPELAGLKAVVTGSASSIDLSAASPLSGSTTGTALPVDGGMSELRVRPRT
jgi:hypothetical protein